MRRIILLLSIFVVILLGMVGCKNQGEEVDTSSELLSAETPVTVDTEDFTEDATEEYADKEIAKIYREVLKSERTFISVNEGGKETLLSDFSYYDGEYVESVLKTAFCLQDIDNDGNYEIEVHISTEKEYPLATTLLLAYRDGEVYGYSLPKWIVIRYDNIIGWSNIRVNEPDEPSYVGYGEICIENHELKYRFLFEQRGSDEEIWMVERGYIQKENIVYVEMGYEDSLCFNENMKSSHALVDSAVDKYVK